MTANETMVRMGEIAASAAAGHVLVSLGLGSCIGLALLDRRTSVAGLAHVVLPSSDGHASASGGSLRFADRAVPALIDQMVGLGARRIRLEAALVGGASMFALGKSNMEVGQRNEQAVLEQLIAARIPVIASATGGTKGRTVRVEVSTTSVIFREAGERDRALVEPAAPMPALGGAA